ncbi:MAG: polysaccharide biosynthesis tyrosine autokinase, partial [Lachnospiraceae bacterium]|nr:polysaccharide biosynthesis tyrosine autokinase [Lachnospiraceae bacterium]
MEQQPKNIPLLDRIDPYSLLRDWAANLWVILLASAAVGMLVNLYVRSNLSRSYTTSTTFVVSSQTNSTSSYYNLSAANTMASSFSSILQSSLMRKRVCRDLGLDSFNATTSVGIVGSTNLLTLRVTSESPYMAYAITRSIMDNIRELAEYVSADMVMDVLIQPAVPRKADAAASANRRMFLSALAAFLVFSALFLVLSFLKNTVKGEKDLENKVDGKAIGAVYHQNPYRSLKDFFGRKTSKLLITELTAGFEFTERFRKIAQNVMSSAERRGAKTILLTSVMEHEGKTTVSANLALALAAQEKKVLLIDCDLRRPSLYKLFSDVEDNASVNFEMLFRGTAKESPIVYDSARHLYLFMNRRRYTNSTDIVSSDYMKTLFKVLRDHFDYVVVDTPPMGLMADAENLANLSDLSIMVVGYDTSLAEDVNDAIDALRTCRAHFLGCILNDIHELPFLSGTTVGYGGYRSGYGRYGSYGKYGSYGRYGRYGRYGAYSHYAADAEAAAETEAADDDELQE